jgi:hypothetical protein
MATDIEGNSISRLPVPNPYTGDPSSNLLPVYHPFNILKRCAYMGVSFFGLNHFNAYAVILHSPHVRHEWFKIGLAATIGMLAI